MPDTPGLPVLRWGEELRRRRREGRGERARLVLASFAALATGLLAGTLAGSGRPWLVWNATASSPEGLYRIARAAAPGRGERVLALPPAWAASLADARGYLPLGIPLVKPVAATAGDRVCGAGDALLVNGALRGRRLREDGRGRVLPRWEGCRRLGAGELLLLSEAPDSFDGRYFGPSAAGDVIGRARLVWRR